VAEENKMDNEELQKEEPVTDTEEITEDTEEVTETAETEETGNEAEEGKGFFKKKKDKKDQKDILIEEQWLSLIISERELKKKKPQCMKSEQRT